MTPLLAMTPSHRVAAALAIAANRAGETGILDLGYGDDVAAIRAEIDAIAQHSRHATHWGVRWDGLDSPARPLDRLESTLAGRRVPILVLGGLTDDQLEMARIRQRARAFADRVYWEVTHFGQAVWAEQTEFDGVIARGFEAGGRISFESTLCLLQRLSGKLRIPFWVQGGIGPDTAAAALLAGAAGVVLCEQLWLAEESSLSAGEKSILQRLEGKETVAVGDIRAHYRFFSTRGRQVVAELDRAIASGGDWRIKLAEGLVAERPLIPCGQDISLAKRLAEQHVNVAGIIKAYRLRSQENFKMACRSEILAPDAPLAESHGTKYPIVQGPVAGVTDEPEFARMVADAGALPLLALGDLDVDLARERIAKTRAALGSAPWGVALSFRDTSSLLQKHFEIVQGAKPPIAVVDARQSDWATALEKEGTATYLHVDNHDVLAKLLTAGHCRFIIEGNETGGPVGPRTSFSLWQNVIDILMEAKIPQPEKIHLVFAGPIHDSLSSALTASAVAPLSAKGMRIGVQVGSAYLFTPEAVASRSITEEYHRRILACTEIAHLEPGIGPTIRAVPSPFVEEFRARRSELIHQGRTWEEMAAELNKLAQERLKLAAKGTGSPGSPEDAATLAQRGLFRVGEVAVLRHEPISMRDLHEEVSRESVVLLEKLAAERLPWHPEPRRARPKSEDIAIVGMACKFPKAEDLRAYWENICNSVDAIEEVSPERWRPDMYFDADRMARDRIYSKWGGFLSKVRFDPMKWRIPPAALKAIEPIQLLSLEVAFAAMADAGYDRREFPRERTGVLFACAGSHDLGSAYAFRTMLRQYLPRVESLTGEAREQLEEALCAELPEWTEDSFPGFLMNVVAGRVARELNVNGPNYTVDAACAASLAAFHASIEQLRSGTSDMVLVGGVDWGNNPMCYMSFSKTHALSPRGRSRPFDESGDGIALGEGIGVVLLKRLRDAERDGDHVYCVIKGIGSSSDGKNKSLTAPYPPGQIKAVERAYEDADLCPTSVSLIEAHGTGTVVGDSAEITTLSEVFGSRTEEKQFAAVGSVKSMIGHTKTVAGMASMIKTALALKHRVLPPTIGIEKPTSRFDFTASPFYVNTQTRPWIEDRGEHPRRAGVSAFGFGGTNFHVVLEEYTGGYRADESVNLSPRSAELFAWGGETKQDVLNQVRELAGALAEAPSKGLAPLSATVLGGLAPAGNRARLALVASTMDELRKKLDRALGLLADRDELVDPTGIFYSQAAAVDPNNVCFLYPGQGSQYVNMLRDLLVGFSWGQTTISRANKQLARFLDRPLSRYIFPPPAFSEEETKQDFTSLSNTRVAQPALGVVELFATDLLARFGLRPGSVAGHSYGEHVALYAAGVLGREDLVWLSAMRGQVCADIAATSPGGMAAVQADARTTQQLFDELGLSVYLANMNAPDQTIIAGSEADIEKAVAAIAGKGIRAKRIPVSAPFHTPLLEAGSHAMAEHFAGAAFHRPKIPVYSNTTGKRHSDSPDEIRDLLTRHFSEPVHFEEEIREIAKDGARVFIECGPGKVLSELVGRILKDQPVVALPMDVPGRDGWTQFGQMIARCFVLGLPVEVSEWSAGRGLPSSTVADLLSAWRDESTVKKSDWVLGPTRVEPAIAPPPAPKKPFPTISVKITAREENGVATSAPVANGTSSAPSRESAAPPREPARVEVSAPPPVPVVKPSAPAMPMVAAMAPEPAKSLSSARMTEAPRSNSGTIRRTAARPVSRLLDQRTRTRQQANTRTLTRMKPVMTNTNAVPLEASSQANGAHAPVGNGTELFIEVQASTRMFLEFQHSQQLLMERFLETQERLLAMCLGKGVSAAPVLPAIAAPPVVSAPVVAAPVAAAPVYANGHAPAPVAVAPAAPAPAPAAPVARAPIAVPTGRTPATVPPTMTAAPPTARPVPSAAAPEAPKPAPAKAPAVAAPAPVAAAASTGGAPPVEEFRKDLLAVISERTGYPEDMLDEELPLEAGLGIDSIKTVEIFSTLKKYHPYMRDEDRDEEEALAEFTRLKTIRDIINAYQSRLDKLAGEAPAGGADKNGVERHAITAIEAPLGGAGAKKNSLAST